MFHQIIKTFVAVLSKLNTHHLINPLILKIQFQYYSIPQYIETKQIARLTIMYEKKEEKGTQTDKT